MIISKGLRSGFKHSEWADDACEFGKLYAALESVLWSFYVLGPVFPSPFGEKGGGGDGVPTRESTDC
jgi:hypothetical protein